MYKKIFKMAVTTFNKHADVTKSDATVFAEESSIYVGTAGDIALVLVGSSTAVTYHNVPAGTLLPCNVKQVLSTGTTASDIVRGFN